MIHKLSLMDCHYGFYTSTHGLGYSRVRLEKVLVVNFCLPTNQGSTYGKQNGLDPNLGLNRKDLSSPETYKFQSPKFSVHMYRWHFRDLQEQGPHFPVFQE